MPSKPRTIRVLIGVPLYACRCWQLAWLAARAARAVDRDPVSATQSATRDPGICRNGNVSRIGAVRSGENACIAADVAAEIDVVVAVGVGAAHIRLAQRLLC